jgi:hypothetical protein
VQGRRRWSKLKELLMMDEAVCQSLPNPKGHKASSA